ncbi:hypothetical protein CI109_107060 [Kwoniella shandongensis]|uniref:Uncharacterized protein n=1 Tax=Kwoniella shandongensis TaxID=1734106 RepID=A0A5M6BT34_9TREE|nr:uncharacterized protein CI109_006469 [Kwoniella shandongensis]KAA5525200.1 hypothetical protein CI109_006469 [Kwoniella shandongensis]
MQSADPGHLFQTTQQIKHAAEREKKLKAAEKVGDPIIVTSKVLDLVVRDQEGWTGESGWQARRIDLRTGKTLKLYKGHEGPVTTVALYDLKREDGSRWIALFTGSWDKTIRIWDAESGELLHTLEGHTDFVKSLTVLPTSPPLLLSTSSDRTCRLWDLSSLSTPTTTAPRSVQTLKDHTRPVECATYKVEVDGNGRPTGALGVWTGDSLGIIKKWQLREGKLVFLEDVKGHETSVAQLSVGEEGLWSVSMDKTAIYHPFDTASSSTIPHPSYAKSVLPLPEDFPIPRTYTLTGSEDEDIRIWDMENATKPKLVGTIRGHCGEVTVMRVWLREGEDGKRSWGVVTGGLDQTLRRWTVQDILNPPVLDYEPAEEKEDVGMTEEEERELAELMSDQD